MPANLIFSEALLFAPHAVPFQKTLTAPFGQRRPLLRGAWFAYDQICQVGAAPPAPSDRDKEMYCKSESSL